MKIRLALALLAAVAMPVAAQAAVINGTDWGGANLTVSDGDVLVGSFTNVGSFTLGAGLTAYVGQGSIFSLSANSITIGGTLDGTGRGYLGGAAVGDLQSGLSGQGPTGGAGGLQGQCVHSSAGGGGGNGGAGGDGGSSYNPAAAGGGVNASPFAMGSGGGSGGSHCDGFDPGQGGAGGAGGGAAYLMASDLLTLTGSIIMNGFDGSDAADGGYYAPPGGGGGAGGAIWLSGDMILDGLLSVRGGAGGDHGDSIYNDFDASGGGGGGGRIILDGRAQLLSAFMTDVAGGVGGLPGVNAPQNGQVGTFLNNTTELPEQVPEPAVPALLGLGVLALGLGRRRKAA